MKAFEGLAFSQEAERGGDVVLRLLSPFLFIQPGASSHGENVIHTQDESILLTPNWKHLHGQIQSYVP